MSATKILKLASNQGQKIYQIDRSNANTVLPQLSHSNQVIIDISNAVSAGKVVTTSEKSINFNGWSGSGYILTDPNTGSGAYMISGGANGGFAYALGLAAGAMLAALIVGFIGTAGFGAIATAPFILGLAWPLIVFFSMLLAVVLYANRDNEFVIGCFLGGFTFNLGIAAGELGRIPGVIGAIFGGYKGINSWSACYGV